MKNAELLTKPNKNLEQVERDEGVNLTPETLTEKQIGEKIREEFTALWNIYEGRRNGNSMRYGRTTVEDDVIATRYLDNEADQHAIEEVYWRTTLYGPNQRDGKTEMYFINISSPGEDEYQICVTENQHVKVLNRHTDSHEWHTASDEAAEKTLEEFFHRTLIAATTHENRTPEEKLAADEDAKRLLLERYPILGEKKTSVE